MGTGFEGELLQRLVAHAPALLCILDQEGRFVAVNEAWTSILGWRESELLGTSFRRFTHPDDLAASQASLDRGFGGDDTAGYINRILTADGGYRWISWSAPANEPPNGIAIGVDVTEEREARAEAERTRARLRSVLETAPGYITIVDRHGTIEYINRTYEGLTVDQVVGTNLVNWIAPEWRESMQAALDRVFTGEPVGELVNAGSGPDGGTTWYRTTFGPLVRDGEVVAATLYGEDITTQMRAERARARSSRYEVAGRLIGAIAHDLNNILMTMQSSADLLGMERDVPVDDPSMSLLVSSIEQASALTRNLVDSFRDRPAPAEPTPLGRALERIRDLLRRAAGERATVAIAAPDDELYVPLAEHELSRLMMNLVVNAGEAGATTIHVAVTERDIPSDGMGPLAPGEYVVLDVTDDGPGIPDELCARVFDPYFTTKPSGSGFGLATCYSIVSAVGGDIDIVCPRLGGTVVQCWLPRTAGSDTGDSDSDRSSSSSYDRLPTPMPPGRAAVILLVEDEHRTRGAVGRYLTRLGHVVLEARDGEDALDVARRHPGEIDAVVTDVVMPRRGGVSLIAELRRDNPTLAAIAMTGHAATEDLEKLRAMKVPVRTKPVAPRDLHDGVLTQMERLKRRSEE